VIIEAQQIIDSDYIAQRAHQELLRDELSYFVQTAKIKLDGQPFSFDNHEYLEEPYEEIRKHRELILEKAAQMGLSTLELLNAYHGSKYGAYPHGILYLLPSKTDVTEFSKSKAQSIVDENPIISSWIGSSGPDSTNTANIKKIGNSLLYFRGMQSRIGLKTITVDMIVFDEIEEVEDWSLVALAEERMSHIGISDNAGEDIQKITRQSTVHRLSVPSIPGWGIDAYFAGNDEAGIRPSDQRYRMFKCLACNEWNCFEDEFPDCIVIVNDKDEKAIRVCKKCGREISLANPEVRRSAEWVPKEPLQRVRGYHFSQLFSRFVNPYKIINQFNKKHELTTLFNDKLGIPYVDAEARLEIKDLVALETSDPQHNAHPGPCGMGVDQPKDEGGKFHIVIGYRMEKQPCNIIRMTVRTKWQELGDLMKQFNVGRCVIDGQPDQAKAREFARAFPGKVFLCYYAKEQKGAPKWNEGDYIVSVDRTESINNSTRAVHEQKISTPRLDDDVKIFQRHCHNMARKRQVDKDTGSVRQIWVKTGPDHYRHAFNYLYLALPEIGEYVPPRKETDWMHNFKKERNWKTI